ncbi:MAG: PLP-dependent aminotransferase family protein [Lachnospiraceae bacterium]|nr:PLP-dependent aminotransferase family protein [Lachnospiraceae bacterium]
MNDLTINLDVHSSVPLYEQIYKYIKKEIQSGGLPFGERLPSTRKLAKYLQVSRTTVDMAYEQLVSEGYIEAKPYKGYFICELEGLYHLEPESAPEKPEKAAVSETYRYDFSPNGVDLNSFPQNAWRKLSKGILLEENRLLFQLGDPQGEYELRGTIAQYLHQARGVEAAPEQIIIGAGNDFLLLLLCSMFGTGQRIAMESPTYKKAYDLFRNLSNEVRIVEMDESGMRIDQLADTDAQIAYVMPSHQYPLGTVMPVKRRMQLLEWAGTAPGRYIIEDDYDSEFRYKGKPIPALQGYDRHDRVIYIGTFSKSIAPAIRVSYMVLPKQLMELYRRRGRTISCTVSRVDQMLIAAFLNEGYYERHLNKMRAVYKGRHDVLLEELRAFRRVCRISGENAGVHILLTFTNGMKEAEAVSRAAERGVKVYGLSWYFVGEAKLPAEETVILGYANLQEEEIRDAAACLKEAWLEAV